MPRALVMSPAAACRVRSSAEGTGGSIERGRCARVSEGSLPGRDVAPGSDQPRGEEAPQIVVEARQRAVVGAKPRCRLNYARQTRMGRQRRHALLPAIGKATQVWTVTVCSVVLTFLASSTCPQSMVICSPGRGSRCSGATRCHWPPDTGCTRSRSIVVRALTGRILGDELVFVTGFGDVVGPDRNGRAALDRRDHRPGVPAQDARCVQRRDVATKHPIGLHVQTSAVCHAAELAPTASRLAGIDALRGTAVADVLSSARRAALRPSPIGVPAPSGAVSHRAGSSPSRSLTPTRRRR